MENEKLKNKLTTFWALKNDHEAEYDALDGNTGSFWSDERVENVISEIKKIIKERISKKKNIYKLQRYEMDDVYIKAESVEDAFSKYVKGIKNYREAENLSGGIVMEGGGYIKISLVTNIIE